MRQDILLSMQRALLGMVYPSIRAIAVGFDATREITVRYYLDRPPTEDDYENLSEVVTEVLSDIAFDTVKEECLYSTAPIADLDPLEAFVYVRRES